MILYDAADIKVGTSQVSEVRIGAELVWPAITTATLWNFNTPAGGEVVEIVATFFGSVDVDWGDDNIDTLSSNSSTTHTY